MNLRKVVIIQETIPEYRRELFAIMKQNALEYSIDLKIVDCSKQALSSNQFSMSLSPVEERMKVKKIQVFNLQLYFRDLTKIIDSSDLVILEQSRRFLDLYLNLIKKRTRIALWGHGKDFVKTEIFFKKFLLNMLTRRSDWFFGYTQESTEAVIEIGFDEVKTTTLWNTIDTKSLVRHKNEILWTDVREFIVAKKMNQPIGLFLGTLTEEKRVRFLLDASILIHRAIPDFHLAVCGEGPLVEIVRSYSRNHKWINYIGAVYGRDKAIALQSSQLLMIPGRIGLVSVEALIFDKKIVTVKSSNHAPEIAYLKNDNLILTENDIKDYADKCVTALKETNEKTSLESLLPEFLRIESMAERFLLGINSALEVQI